MPSRSSTRPRRPGLCDRALVGRAPGHAPGGPAPGPAAGPGRGQPLGAVPDGGASDLDRILAERVPPELAARAQELDQRAIAGEGTAEDALERLAIVWPGYFSSPGKAPPMPPLSLSLECYAGTFASIYAHFERKTLERCLPSLRIPAVFLLGAASPIPPQHGVASAALIPGARQMIEDDCGHFLWLNAPDQCAARCRASAANPGLSPRRASHRK